ncbi:MAG: ABC transporter substrate-binding protein [Betaproteobacteria bacterium]|nr:ABC transporter substrate-binding protein [Betaproteobacteria bacterium]
MEKRRKLVIALGAGALATPLCSFAQQQGKVWRIGFLGAASASGYVKEIDAIRAGLRDLGYVEGRNIVIEYRWAENNPERLKELAAELIALKVDAIIAHGGAGSLVASRSTRTTPIVIADGPDPVTSGLVASLARPGGNITGSTGFQTELAAKRLELLKEALPRLKRVSILSVRLNPNKAVTLREMENAAKVLKLEPEEFEVRAIEEFSEAFTAMVKKRVEAVVIYEDPLTNSNLGIVAALARTHRLPAIGITTFPDAGGLLGYGREPFDAVWPRRQLRRQDIQGRQAG